MSTKISSKQNSNSEFDPKFVSDIDIKFPKLYNHLMELNKAEMKFITMFLLNYNNPEYAVEEVRNKAKHLKLITLTAFASFALRFTMIKVSRREGSKTGVKRNVLENNHF